MCPRRLSLEKCLALFSFLYARFLPQRRPFARSARDTVRYATSIRRAREVAFARRKRGKASEAGVVEGGDEGVGRGGAVLHEGAGES